MSKLKQAQTYVTDFYTVDKLFFAMDVAVANLYLISGTFRPYPTSLTCRHSAIMRVVDSEVNKDGS